MVSLFTSASNATKSLTHWPLFKIFIASIVLNALILAGIVALISWLLTTVNLFGMWDWLADWGLSFLAATIAYFIFPILLPLIISFFDTAIAEIIEKEEYTNIPAPEPPFWPTLMQDVRFTLKALLLNALCLPLYLIPGINIVFYYFLNGYLLGTEFFNVVAGRHIGVKSANKLRKKNRFNIILCGAVITFCATTPFLNLVSPIWGVALMVHYFHNLKPDYKSHKS